MPNDGDPKFSATLAFTLAGALLIFALIVALQGVFYRVERTARGAKWDSGMPTQMEQSRTQQLEQLNAYRWIDEPKGVVAVPIERAMELVVEEAASVSSKSDAPAFAAPPLAPDASSAARIPQASSAARVEGGKP